VTKTLSIEMANDEGYLHDHTLACEKMGVVSLRHFGEEGNGR
jgi:hypothetical protein